MTDEQINIAIAEACGWARIRLPLAGPRLASPMMQKSPMYCASIPDTEPSPNYCNDLNAIHEAELATFKTGGAWGEYFDYLSIVCDLGNDPITATARQRSEAFLKTIGKWE